MTDYTFNDHSDIDLDIANTPLSKEIEKEEQAETTTPDGNSFEYTSFNEHEEEDIFNVEKKAVPNIGFESIEDFENDEEVIRDFDIVASSLGERGEGIAETLRDSDNNIFSAIKRSYQVGNFSNTEKEAYNRLVTKFSNSKLKGTQEWLNLIGNFTVDTVRDPLTLLSFLAAPFTFGLSIPAKQALVKAGTEGLKRYTKAKLLGEVAKGAAKPAIFTGLEGATFTGLLDYYNQDIDISLGNKDSIDWSQLGKSSALGFGIGFGIGGLGGTYSGAKLFQRASKYHNEDAVLKHINNIDRETVKTADEVTAANKDFYKDKKTIFDKTPSDWLDKFISRVPFGAKATAEFLSKAKRVGSIRDFLLAFRYDATRTIFGKKQSKDSLGKPSYFENVADYQGQYIAMGINRAFNHIGTVRGGKITPKDNNALHTLMLDDSAQKFRHSDGLDYDIPVRVKEAYFGKKDTNMKGIKQILDDIFEEGVNLKEFDPIQKVANYFPRLFNHGVLSQEGPRNSFKKLLKDYGYATPNNSVNEKKYLTKYITASGKEEVGIPADTLGLDLEIFGKDFIEEAKRKLGANATDSQISNLAQDLKADQIIQDMLDLRYNNFTTGVGPRAGSKGFQQHRIFSSIPDEKLGAFLDTSNSSLVSRDVMEVLSDYTYNVSDLFARKKAFGVRNVAELDDTVLTKIQEDLKITGATDSQIASVLQDLRMLFQEITGTGNATGLQATSGAGRLRNFSSEATRLLQSMAHLVFAVPSSITEPLIPFSRIAKRDYAQGTFNIAEGLYKQFIKRDLANLYQFGKSRLGLGKARYKDMEDEYWQEIYAGGIAFENNLMEGLDRLASGERFYNKSMRNASDVFFKMTLLTSWTRAVQGASFTSGKMLIRRNLQKLLDHELGVTKLSQGNNFRNLGMNQKEYLEKQLEELNIDPKEGMAWYRSSLDDNTLDFNTTKAQNSPFYKKYLDGARRFTNETILNPNRAAAAKSILMQSGWGKIAFQFASYPTVFNNTVVKRMLNELREYPVQTSPKLLATGFLMTSIAMWMNHLRNPERYESLSAEENVIEGAERWGALAQIANVKKGIDASNYGSSFLGSFTRAVFGPTFGDAADSLEYRLTPTSIAVRNIPFQQLVKRVNPKGYKEIQDWAKEMDETVYGLYKEEQRGLYRTGGPVVGVPNAPDRPEERINKYTGVPYDLEAGPTAQPEKDRKGFSEEGKLLATLQRRQKKFAGSKVVPEFEDRINNPEKYPYLINEEGEFVTHRMADADNMVYPLVQLQADGTLKDFGKDFEGAREAAEKSGNFKVFETKEEAQNYAEGGYKTDKFKKYYRELRQK